MSWKDDFATFKDYQKDLDRQADAWSEQKVSKPKENKKRETAIKGIPKGVAATMYDEPTFGYDDPVIESVHHHLVSGPGTVTVLQPEPILLPVVTPPADLVDYSLPPAEATPPWDQTPYAAKLNLIPAVIGTMMVMLGKRMLVSMAVGGLNYALMEPLQQYGKGLPRARVLWHTGQSARPMGGGVSIVTGGGGPGGGGSRGGPDGTGYGGQSFGESFWDGMTQSWDVVKKQWSDPENFFWWLFGR